MDLLLWTDWEKRHINLSEKVWQRVLKINLPATRKTTDDVFNMRQWTFLLPEREYIIWQRATERCTARTGVSMATKKNLAWYSINQGLCLCERQTHQVHLRQIYNTMQPNIFWAESAICTWKHKVFLIHSFWKLCWYYTNVIIVQFTQHSVREWFRRQSRVIGRRLGATSVIMHEIENSMWSFCILHIQIYLSNNMQSSVTWRKQYVCNLWGSPFSFGTTCDKPNKCCLKLMLSNRLEPVCRRAEKQACRKSQSNYSTLIWHSPFWHGPPCSPSVFLTSFFFFQTPSSSFLPTSPFVREN